MYLLHSVVVVEVKQGVKDPEVIQAIQQDYAAHNKEIFIFAVAKGCAKSVEVIVRDCRLLIRG